MRIAIIGPGALGCLFASHLASRHEVWLVDHDAARAKTLSASGIILERQGQRTHHRIPVVTAGRTEALTGRRLRPEGRQTGAAGRADDAADGVSCGDQIRKERAELVLLAVKSPAVARAVADNRELLAQARILLGLQNGIGHLDILAACGPRALAAVTSMGAHCPQPGHVIHAGQGVTEIGPLADTPQGRGLAAETAILLRKAGIPAVTATDIRAAIWNKLLVNVGINALTGILDCANGELLHNPWAVETMRAAIEEATQVARALDIPVAADGFARAQAVCRATARNISSLLQDLRNRRPTEIKAINGAVADLADDLGVAAPVNRMLTERILAIEARQGAPGAKAGKSP